MFLGWLHTTLAEVSTEAHPCADEWDSVLAAAQTHQAGGSLFTPHRRRPCSRNAACWRDRTRCGHGPGLIEEDVDVVDEETDEALTDAPFFVNELEGDDPSEADTIDAEPLPSPSAPADPVQILTRLQALRIVYGESAPK